MQFFVTLCLCLMGLSTMAQSALVRFSEIKFDSEEEQKTIAALLAGEEPYFDAFSFSEGIDPEQVDEWERSYYDYLQPLKTKEKRRDNWTYLNKVFRDLHETYLVQYNNGSNFSETFSDGIYNCVAATAIYAMAFEYLEVPYLIKETTDHVYIVGLSQRGPMQFETTDPVTGFRTFGYDFKKYFVNQLLAQKLIHQSELEKGVDQIFNVHYFVGKEIGLKELVAIQYTNRGLIHFEDKDYHKAFNNFEKAYILYPNEDNQTLLFSAITHQLQYSDYRDWYDVELLARIPRYDEFEINMSGIIGGFERVNQYYHIDRSDFERFEAAHQLVRRELPEPYRTELDYYYHYERARILYNRGDYVKALDFTINAFENKPMNAEIEVLLLNSFRQFLRAPKNEMETALVRLENLIEENNHLAQNKKFGGLILDFYLVRMSEAFHNSDGSVGDDLHQRFTELVENNPDFQFDPYIVGRAYSTAVYFYVQNGQMSTANTFLNTGLDYAPFNVELINSKSLIKR